MQPSGGAPDTLAVAGGGGAAEGRIGSPDLATAVAGLELSDTSVPSPSDSSDLWFLGLPPTPPPPHRLNNADKAIFLRYFIRRKWPRSAQIPRDSRSNYHHEVYVVMRRLGLNRDQVTLCLRHYKRHQFEGEGATYASAGTEETKQRILDDLSTSDVLFCLGVLQTMVAPASNIDGELERHHKKFLLMQPDSQPILDDMIARFEGENGRQDDEKVKVVLKFFDGMVGAMAEAIPNKAKSLTKAELSYMKAMKRIKEVAINKAADLFDDDILTDSILTVGRRALRNVFSAFFSRMQVQFHEAFVDQSRPPVVFPDTDLVSEYAVTVVYYSGSFVISRCKGAKSISVAERAPFFRFAERHLISKDEAKEAGLPTGLVDRRDQQIGGFHRMSKECFAFIKMIESVFVKNLSLPMMLAYAEGDLVLVIGKAILENDQIKAEFGDLAESADIDSDDERYAVFVFVMNIYITMRGRWFVRTIKKQETRKSLFSKAATRKQVANAVETSKAAAAKSSTVQASVEAPVDASNDGDDASSGVEDVYEMVAENLLMEAGEGNDDEIEEESMGVDLEQN